ncbi:MAG: GIY-YIG nuclease family protein [Pseudanabaenales cyanobacterium]|nr:GIY-YIG nuclease family protein [Pseudanabaenales cyanobacterium]
MVLPPIDSVINFCGVPSGKTQGILGRIKLYYVYILTSRSKTLYIGMTNRLIQRVLEHQAKQGSVFTSKYNIDRLIYFEETDDVHAAIAREKQLKGWSRAKKIALIESMNPEWRDLSIEG